MAKLTKQQKVWLVQCLAEYHSPTEASKAFLEEWGVEIEPKQVERYDPNKYSGQQLAKELKALFHQHRKDYLRNTKKHLPLANKSVRLKMLTRMAKKAERMGNDVQAAKYLEQIAKEIGGSYTNQRQFTGKDGGPIQTEDVTRMPTEQIEAELRAMGVNPDDIRPGSPRTTH